jgi:hypothetical protein
MKKYVLIIAISFMINKGWAQNTNLDYRYAMKLYNLTSWEKQEYLVPGHDTGYSYFNKERNLSFFHPTIAFQWKTKKNNFREIELTKLEFGKHRLINESIDNNDTTAVPNAMWNINQITAAIEIRLEYTLNLFKSRNWKLVPSVGFALSPYYNQTKTSYTAPSKFSAITHNTGAKMFVIPRITYYFTPKIFLDVNLPISPYIFNYRHTIYSEPDAQNKSNSRFDIETNENFFHGRIGIGIKL